MIDAIVPVPNRIRPGQVLRGSLDVEYYRPDELGTFNQISGRDIQSPPLTFYKVFSTFGNFRYEHVFATDELLDPIYLTNSRDAYTGVQSATPSLLVPISVKTISDIGCDTFLFTKNIDYLLRNYIMGYKISSLRPFNNTAPQYQDRIVINPTEFNGVVGMNMYAEKLLSAVHNIGHGYYQPEISKFQLLSYLCPERPSEMHNLLKEIIWFEKNPDAFFGYLDDIYTYDDDNKFEPLSLLDAYFYNAWLDPITVYCLKSPTYISTDQLKPFLGDINQRIGYYNITLNQARATEEFNFHELDIRDDDRCFILDVLGILYETPDSDINVCITRSGQSEYKSMNTVPFCNYKVRERDLTATLYQAFMNWTRHQYTCDYDYITISKTWLGELMVYCHSNIMPPRRFYMNMNIFHLMTPSLADRHMYDRCQM